MDDRAPFITRWLRSVRTACVAAAAALCSGCGSMPFSYEGVGPYDSQIVVSGGASRFRGGAAYRGEAPFTRIVVSGDHYEMGVQYGALLRDEIGRFIAFIETHIEGMAGDAGVAPGILRDRMERTALAILDRAPARFVDELRGVAEGTGFPFKVVARVALSYECLSALGCTSVLLPGPGGIVHGRNQDVEAFGGPGLAAHAIAVRLEPIGRQAITCVAWPLILGFQTAASDSGIGFSEQTYTPARRDPDGESMGYRVRAAMEDNADLDGVLGALAGLRPISGSGCVFSDRKTGRGARLAMAPGGSALAICGDAPLYDFNSIDEPSLKGLDSPLIAFGGDDYARRRMARDFSPAGSGGEAECIRFLRLSTDPRGQEAALASFVACGINNEGTQQSIVFDPEGGSLLVAADVSYAASSRYWRLSLDLRSSPTIAAEAERLPAWVVELRGLKAGRADVSRYLALAEANPSRAEPWFCAGAKALSYSDYRTAAMAFGRASTLSPSSQDIAFGYALAEYRLGRRSVASAVLSAMERPFDSPWHEALFLRYREALGDASAPGELARLLDRYGVASADYRAGLGPLSPGDGRAEEVTR